MLCAKRQLTMLLLFLRHKTSENFLDAEGARELASVLARTCLTQLDLISTFTVVL